MLMLNTFKIVKESQKLKKYRWMSDRNHKSNNILPSK